MNDLASEHLVKILREARDKAEESVIAFENFLDSKDGDYTHLGEAFACIKLSLVCLKSIDLLPKSSTDDEAQLRLTLTK